MRRLTLALLASAALSMAMASEVWAAGHAPVTGIVKSEAVMDASARRGRGVVGRRGLYRGGARYTRRGGVYVSGGYSTGGTAYSDEGYSGGGVVYSGAYARHRGVYAGRGLAAGRKRLTPGARLFAGHRSGVRHR